MGVRLGYADLVLLLNAIYYLPCVFLPVCINALRHNGAGLRLGPVSFGQMLMCMVLAYLCVMLANAVGGLWSILLETAGLQLYGADVELDNSAELIKGIFAMAVLPGICEELLFRGTVLTAYERGGTRRALIVSTLLFASLHGSLQGLPVQLIIGVVLGCVACFTGSIYAAMMVHTAYNAFILLISYMTPDTAAASGTLYSQIGGMYGVGVLIVEAVVMILLIRLVLKSFARKGMESGIVFAPEAKTGMDLSETAVLISGIVTVCYMYIEDIVLLTGH